MKTDPATRSLAGHYRQGEDAGFLDSSGKPGSPPAPSATRRRAVPDGDGGLLAVAIRAFGETAVLWLERERLADELGQAKESLEASRLRLAQAADEERLDIQRDLHDGAQQHLIAMNMKLERALETIPDDPAGTVRLLTELGEEMGDAWNNLGALASRVFPPTLREYGPVDALTSAIRRMGLSVTLDARGVGRHPPEVETQVYFVCLEALQNMSKHGGPGVSGTLRLWEARRWLFLELRDNGPGFDPADVSGHGLQNMHDRVASVGGQLVIESSRGHGTTVRGGVPTRPAPVDAR